MIHGTARNRPKAYDIIINILHIKGVEISSQPPETHLPDGP